MGEIKVSVIVPVYNVEKYLEECVESLIGQTLKEIEILLIDDGSTDSSGEICNRYANVYKNIRVIHKSNGGLGAARNTGFSESKGKYVYFIDSDDLLGVDALQFLYEEAEKKQLEVILFSAECFSDEEDIIYDKDGYKRTQHLNEVISGRELFEKLFYAKEYYASIPMRFYRKDFLEKKGYSFPEIIHEDELYGFLSLVEAFKAECIEKRFYKRRFRKGSIMTSEKAYNSAMGYVYTWKGLIQSGNGNDSQLKKIHLVYANAIMKLIMNLYCESFSREEKGRFTDVQAEMRKIAGKDIGKMDRGIQMFLKCPFVYGQYRTLRIKLSKKS